jgi:hypothetical protein
VGHCETRSAFLIIVVLIRELWNKWTKGSASERKRNIYKERKRERERERERSRGSKRQKEPRLCVSNKYLTGGFGLRGA